MGAQDGFSFSKFGWQSFWSVVPCFRCGGFWGWH